MFLTVLNVFVFLQKLKQSAEIFQVFTLFSGFVNIFYNRLRLLLNLKENFKDYFPCQWCGYINLLLKKLWLLALGCSPISYPNKYVSVYCQQKAILSEG